MNPKDQEVAALAKIRGDLLVDRALALSQDDRDEEAIDLLRKLLLEQPDNERANENLGRYLLYRGQVREAIRQFKQYLQVLPQESPGFCWPRIQFAINMMDIFVLFIDQALDNLISLNRYSEALALLEDLETLVSPPMRLDSVLLDEEDSEELEVLLRRFAMMLHQTAFRYHKVAQASSILKAYEKTVACMETAFTLSHIPDIVQNLPIAHLDIADHFASQEQWGQAIEHLQRAVEVDPEFIVGWWRLCVAYIQLGDSETGYKYLARAAELGDKKAIAWMAKLAGK